MDRLARVQQEIELKNTRDRLETEQIFKDLFESNKRLVQRNNNSPFRAQNLPQNVIASQPVNFDDSISGNIRLESHFTRVAREPINAGTGPKVGEGLEARKQSRVTETTFDMDKSVIGGPSQSVAAATENRSAIGRLDDLIDDFNKPMSIQE